MRQRNKLLLIMFLIITMLLQIGTVYADEGSANSMDITRQTSSNAEPKEIATTLASSTAGTITGLENGRSYYIMNLGTKKLLATRSAADTNGNTIVGRDRSELTNRQWELTVLGNSTGKLIWADSSTGKGVAISGESAILSAETETLTIQRINANNNYQGFYTIKYGGKYLSFYTDEDTPYYYIQLTTMLNQNSVWSFMDADKDFADIFSFTYAGYDSSANDENFALLFDTLGYNSWVWNNSSAEDAYDCMQDSSNIWIFRGHGNPGVIGFYNSSGVTNGRIRAGSSSAANTSASYYLSAIPTNGIASAQCVMYIGCSTGVTSDEGYNLLNQTFDKGASFVMGTKQSVYPDDSNKFLLGFMQGIADGKNIRDSIEEGVSLVGMDADYSNFNYEYPVTTVGDAWQYLNFTAQTIEFDTEDILE